MRLDVVFTPRELEAGEVSDRTVVVVDVLRATTSICAALHHGARAIVATADIEEATRLAQALGTPDVVLAGERNMQRIAGFQLGNSPLEMTADVVRDKTVIMTTTNGTQALLATAGAREVVVAAAVNLTAAGDYLHQVMLEQDNLLILCAGRERNFGLDDAYVAGLLAVRALRGTRRRKGLNDAALVAVDLVSRYRERVERVLAVSSAGRDLTAHGFHDDIRASAAIDAHPVVPFFHERRVTLAPAGARRP